MIACSPRPPALTLKILAARILLTHSRQSWCAQGWNCTSTAASRQTQQVFSPSFSACFSWLLDCPQTLAVQAVRWACPAMLGPSSPRQRALRIRESQRNNRRETSRRGAAAVAGRGGTCCACYVGGVGRSLDRCLLAWLGSMPQQSGTPRRLLPPSPGAGVAPWGGRRTTPVGHTCQRGGSGCRRHPPPRAEVTPVCVWG